MLKVIVLYPQPADVEKFEVDYANHLALLHQKTGIPTNVKPHTVTKFLPSPQRIPPYYKMFTMPFDSPEVLQATMSSAAMQEVAADANRISTGGAITVLIASEEENSIQKNRFLYPAYCFNQLSKMFF